MTKSEGEIFEIIDTNISSIYYKLENNFCYTFYVLGRIFDVGYLTFILEDYTHSVKVSKDLLELFSKATKFKLNLK